jgi:hypothetical protein
MTFLRHDTAVVREALISAGFTMCATATRERMAQLNEKAAQTFVIAVFGSTGPACTPASGRSPHATRR